MMPIELRTAIKTFGGAAQTCQVPMLQGLFKTDGGAFLCGTYWRDLPIVVLYYKGYMCNDCGHSDEANLQQAHWCGDCKSTNIEHSYTEVP
jgi:hypothetical protein